MPSKDLGCLIQPFQDSVKELLDKAKDIPYLKVVETCRTLEEQKEKVRLGYSKTLKSKHLTGEAVDIYVDKYDPKLYDKLYEVCKSIDYIIYPHYDLGWGQSGFIDRMHFEYDKNKKQGEYMTEQEFSEVCWNVANGFKITYNGYQPNDKELEGDVKSMLDEKTRMYSISTWVNSRIHENWNWVKKENLDNEKTKCNQRIEETAKNAVDEANQTNTEMVKRLNDKINSLQAERDTLEATKQGLQDELAKKPKVTEVIVEKPVEAQHSALEYLALFIKKLFERK